jgi:plastocyanin domain-containing protein
MSMDQLLVIVAGVMAIAWVNWYFFFAGGTVARASVGVAGVQEVRIRVAGGYDPAHVRVRRGVPVRMVFDRQESSGCSEEVVLPDFGIRRYLPAHEETAVEFTPQSTGTYPFTCGMSMLRGSVTVEDDQAGKR